MRARKCARVGMWEWKNLKDLKELLAMEEKSRFINSQTRPLHANEENETRRQPVTVPKGGFILWNVTPSRTSYLRAKTQTNHLGKAETSQSRAIPQPTWR